MTTEFPTIVRTKHAKYMLFSNVDHISKEILEKGAWDRLTLTLCDWFLKTTKGAFLDIGANMGAICIPMAQHFPDRTFYAIEAQRGVYYQLCGNVALNGLKNVYPLHLAAVGPDEDGVQIDVPSPDYMMHDNIGAVSLDKRVNEGMAAVTEHVTGVALDGLGLSDIGVVKIDVEGYELNVLKGLGNTLVRCGRPPIIYEVWRNEKYDWASAQKTDIEAFLESIGYEVSYIPRCETAIAQSRDASPKLAASIEMTGEGQGQLNLSTI